MSTVVPVLLVIALVAIVGVLLSGVFVMARGGETSRRYSNRLMRWRVILQALAVLLLLAFFLTGE